MDVLTAMDGGMVLGTATFDDCAGSGILSVSLAALPVSGELVVDIRKTDIFRTFVFEVEGAENFPLDMLRYDACRPAREEDATAIRMSFGDERRHRVRLVKDVMIGTGNNSHLTPRRWESFHWRIVEIAIDSVNAP